MRPLGHAQQVAETSSRYVEQLRIALSHPGDRAPEATNER
jgi:hypothetical protein